MSFWDNVKDSFKNFTQPYSDEDDYDDYEDDTAAGYDEPAAEEPAPRSARRASPFGVASQSAPDFGSSAPSPAPSGFSGQVLTMSSNKQEVVVFHAKTFDDAAKAADELRKKRAIILNMEGIDKALTRRVVDFLSGTIYALDGKIRKVAQSTYLFCPHNMDILGEPETVQADAESYV